MKTLNWGILGTARINRSIIPPLRLSVRNNLVAVASRTQERAQAYADEWHIPAAFGSYEALLKDPGIDVVYIPLPNTMHAEWAIKAAEAGKHVLCEKPIALTVAEVDRMAEAADRAGTVLMEAFMYRFHARTLRVKNMIDEGVLGEIHHVKGAFTFALNRPKDVRWNAALGGGSLWDVGCYPLNFTRYMLDAEPEEVYAHQVLGPSGIDESITAQLHFADGITAQFDSGFRSQFRMYMEIVGNQGSIYLPMAFKPGIRSYIHLSLGNELQKIAVDGNLLYLDEVEEIASRILDKKKALLPLEDSRGNIKAITALYDAAKLGRPVTL